MSSNSTLLYRRANANTVVHMHALTCTGMHIKTDVLTLTHCSPSLSLSLSHTHTCMRTHARAHTHTHRQTYAHAHTFVCSILASIIISQYRLYHIIITSVYAVKQYVIFSDKQTPTHAPDSNLTRTKMRTPSLWNRQNGPMAVNDPLCIVPGQSLN